MFKLYNCIENKIILETSDEDVLISKVRNIAIENCDDDMNIDNIDDAIEYINEYSANLEII